MALEGGGSNCFRIKQEKRGSKKAKLEKYYTCCEIVPHPYKHLENIEIENYVNTKTTDKNQTMLYIAHLQTRSFDIHVCLSN